MLKIYCSLYHYRVSDTTSNSQVLYIGKNTTIVCLGNNRGRRHTHTMNKQQYLRWACELSNQEYNGRFPTAVKRGATYE